MFFINYYYQIYHIKNELLSNIKCPKDATLKEINKNYKSLSSRYHPDKNPNDKYSEEKMKLISEAHTILSDYDKRVLYDKTFNSNITINSTMGLLESFDTTFNNNLLQITDKNIKVKKKSAKKDKLTFF